MTTINFNFGLGEETANSKIQMTNETMPSPIMGNGLSFEGSDSQTIPSPSDAERFSSIESSNEPDPEAIQGAQDVDSNSMPSPSDEESGINSQHSGSGIPAPEGLEADIQTKKTIRAKPIKK